MDHVLNTKQMSWTPLSGPGTSGCEQQRGVIADDYTDAYSADIVRMAAGGVFVAQEEQARCLVSVLSGKGRVIMDGEIMPVAAGAAIKISAGMDHQLENAGDEPLVFLAVYDPPREDSAK